MLDEPIGRSLRPRESATAKLVMTYEYVCTSCGHQWEAEQRISEGPLRDCPKCKKATAKRQVSGGTGFLLKGGGWYADGYGSSSGASKSAEGSGESTDAKSDASSPATSSATTESSAKDKTSPAPGSKGSAQASSGSSKKAKADKPATS